MNMMAQILAEAIRQQVPGVTATPHCGYPSCTNHLDGWWIGQVHLELDERIVYSWLIAKVDVKFCLSDPECFDKLGAAIRDAVTGCIGPFPGWPTP